MSRHSAADAFAQSLPQARFPRPPHPAPRFVTLRNAPLPGQDGDECTTDLISEKQKYFFDWGWTRQNARAEGDLPVGQLR
jgi:hypothetical protein